MKDEKPVLSSIEKKDEIDYKQYVKERFEIDDEEAEKIELFEAESLSEHYKRQYEALNDKKLENVKILVVPDDVWQKSQPSESAADKQLVSFKESYFKNIEKPDEIAWMLHELAHCKRFLDSESSEAYKKDNQTFAFNNIKSEYTYPNNKVEEYAFSQQFEYLKNQGKTRQEIAEMLKEYYKEDDFLFFNKILDKTYKEGELVY
ncbi:MAG: hypothetical protein A2Y98_02375 [Candidatus Portnoybacteria bacterium RBG_19FT_COMBO_36_7]|uniref:Uncharacterized protein n=1 Tax=Candidatus Portnoybacteria bacterium RBG_19FT_COMBO_36_7 TaxID=1801992 RepID=A0A1G2F7W7_9BACT|nr:MAG: hypothetical protein A2Y98_02375 [Candidatus Portnoybacteria bacterium RBG_19FT_COMBO_36_7]